MSAYDSAEACDIVGIFLMCQLRYLFNINNIGPYRDVGVILLCNKNSRKLVKFFKDHDLISLF